MNHIFSIKLKKLLNVLILFYILAVCCMYYWIGYIRDEYPTKSYVSDKLIYLPIIISIIIIGLSILINCIKKGKLSAILNVISLFTIILAYTILCFQLIYYVDIKKTYTESQSQVITITLKELDYLSKQNVNKYIYIGRDSCYTCQTLYPTIEEYAATMSDSFYYYNTEQDRYNNKKEMKQVLNNLNIHEVPAIIHFSDSGTQQYTGNSLQHFLQSNVY